jgi:hypothetical protein
MIGRHLMYIQKQTWSRSFLLRAIAKRIHWIPPVDDFWSKDKFFVVMLLFSFPLILNDFGVLLFLPHAALMLALTFFNTDPIPDLESVEEAAPGEGGDDCTSSGVIESLVLFFSLTLQGGCFPVLIVVEFLFLILPFAAAALSVSTTVVWNWSKITFGVIIVQSAWLFIAAVTFELEFRYCKFKNQRFRPWMFYRFLFQSIWDTLRGKGTLIKMYLRPLAAMTRCCKQFADCGFCCDLFAELALFIFLIAWAAWPNIFPIILKSYFYLFLTLPITGLLLFLAYKVIRENWKN